MDQKPSVGRIVHYVMENESIRAAIVTAVRPNNLDLVIFACGDDAMILPDGTRALMTGHVTGLVTDVPWSSDGIPRTWHWPPRV